MTAHGYGSWLGIGVGEDQAAQKYLEILSENMMMKQSKIPKPTLRRVSQVNTVSSKISVEGSVTMQGTFDSIAVLLKAAMGACSDANDLGGGGYQYDFSLADELPALTLELNRGYSSNFKYTGCKANKLTLSQPVEDYLRIVAEFIGKNESNIASSSPTFYDPFSGIDWEMATTIEFNGVAVEAKLLEFTIENGMDPDDYHLGQRYRDDILRKDFRKVSGKMQMDFDSNAQYELYRNMTEFTVEVVFTGAEIEPAGDSKLLRIYLPKCYFSEGTPNVENPGPVSVEMPFEAYMDSEDAEDEIQLRIVSDSNTLIPA